MLEGKGLEVWARASANPGSIKFDVGDTVQISPTGRDWSDEFPEGKATVTGFGKRGLMVEVEWHEDNGEDTFNPAFLEPAEDVEDVVKGNETGKGDME